MRKRLTERDEYGNADIIGVDGVDLQSNLLYEEMNKVTNALNKLAEYEDLEEQGLLLRLPCKVGDTFYELNECTEPPYAYPRVAHSLQHCVYALERLGKTTFLTQAEAEEKLRELEGK